MELTRRLYVLEEVAASFRWALKQRRVEEAFFWLEELEVSAEGDLAATCMREIWAMRKGVCWLPWIAAWKLHKDSIAGRRALVNAYLHHPKDVLDSSLWMSYVLSCLSDAYWPGFPLSRKGTQNGDLLTDCIEVWCSLKPGLEALPLVLEDWNIDAFEKSLQGNLRKTRTQAVQCYCHLGYTSRGFRLETKLQCTHLYTLLENPVWAGLLETFVTEDYEWKDDSAKEAFYDTYFGVVGDVPDEWSVAEREKSHGRPPNPRDSYSFLRWWNSWVPENHIYIFGTPLKFLQGELKSSNFTKPIMEILQEEAAKRSKNRSPPSRCQIEFVFD